MSARLMEVLAQARLVVISRSFAGDRIVKRFMRDAVGVRDCQRSAGQARRHARRLQLRWQEATRASAVEATDNPRARSAVMRGRRGGRA